MYVISKILQFLKCESPRHFMCAWLSHQLQNQWLIWSYSSIHSNMFYLGLVFIPQVIEAKAVLFCINDILKCCFQRNALCIIQNAFKYRILNSSAIVDALLCHFSQPCFAGCIFCVDIVCDQY